MNENKKLKILIVEDCQTFRSIAIQILKGHDNILSDTANDAVVQFRNKQPDITFLDIDLPDGNGIEVLKQIKEIEPKAHVVMMTGSNKSKDVERSINSGAAGYILKPFNTEIVQRTVEDFIIKKQKALENED